MSSQERKPTVLVTDRIPQDGLSRLLQHCDLVSFGLQHEFTTIVNEVNKSGGYVDAVLITPPDLINSKSLDALGPQLKVVSTYSVGLDHIDIEECKRRGVKVGFTPNVLNNSVAELTIALTVLTARRLREALQVVCDGQWGPAWNSRYWMTAKQISGSVVGFVGLGRIGFTTAKHFKAFEPSKIVYCGNSPKSNTSEIGAEFVTFRDLLNISDFVIVACSLNQSTKHLMNREAFQQMKSSGILVNISRGDIVDQDALYDALTTNQIAAAGLDVTSPEPLPPDHKLLSLPNCVVTPHIASATLRTRTAMFQLAVDNILAGLNNDPLPSSAY